MTRRRVRDSNQLPLNFSVEDGTKRKYSRFVPSLETITVGEHNGGHSTAIDKVVVATTPPINNNPDYSINGNTLVTLRSKVRRVGEARPASHEDHFNLSREIFNGVYSMESNQYGSFNGRYGVPHEILINLTPSEILALYVGAKEYKDNQKSLITPDVRLKILLRRSFRELVEEFVYSGLRRYNAISVMRMKERRHAKIPPLDRRLSQISDGAITDFYNALSQPPVKVREPYPATPISRVQNLEIFYLDGIDVYIGKLAAMFHDLYKMKSTHKTDSRVS